MKATVGRMKESEQVSQLLPTTGEPEFLFEPSQVKLLGEQLRPYTAYLKSKDYVPGLRSLLGLERNQLTLT